MSWRKLKSFKPFWSVKKKYGENIIKRGLEGMKKIESWVENHLPDNRCPRKIFDITSGRYKWQYHAKEGFYYFPDR